MNASSPKRIASELAVLPVSIVNVYFVGRPGGKWVLVDTGLPGRTREVLAAAEARYGAESRPEAILLTHGHFDHSGSALALSLHWDVPVYAHRMEIPFLTGLSLYPPRDPTVGGAIAFLSRFMPSRGASLAGRIHSLHEGSVPGLPDWEWHFTPGHSPGHVSYFRPSDKTLIAGDAFASMDMDSWIGFVTKSPRLSRAGSPFNYDWDASANSVRKLAALEPELVACGHGHPIAPRGLALFSRRYTRPAYGRYIREPARVDERGVSYLPPRVSDPLAWALAGACLTLAAGAGLWLAFAPAGSLLIHSLPASEDQLLWRYGHFAPPRHGGESLRKLCIEQ